MRFHEKMRPAASVVFGTVELLQLILQHLALRDLVRASFACRQWHAITLGSQALRIKLYLEEGAAATSFLHWKPSRHSDWPEPYIKTEPGDGGYPLIELHPLLLETKPEWFEAARSSTTCNVSEVLLLCKKASLLHPTLLSQPPPRNVDVWYTLKPKPRNFGKPYKSGRITIIDEAGVTFGKVRDSFLSWCRPHATKSHKHRNLRAIGAPRAWLERIQRSWNVELFIHIPHLVTANNGNVSWAQRRARQSLSATTNQLLL
jgi:hypothetical protein